MNYLSMMGGIVDFFWCVLAIIPKIIYFFFAAFVSAIDAMQALIRKLAGLDVFYFKNSMGFEWKVQGDPIRNTDPLQEFIYGILGVGERAYAYRGLNTVFWSLSIFSLIILLVSTMVAIIKSHYSEDYATTNPWKYIYTAIKAALTYAIMPIVVVIGVELATFILRTLDHITAGYATGDTLKGIYGTEAIGEQGLFKGGDGDDSNVYGRYDYFGYGTPTTATTFGGMLFKAAAYSSSRVRLTGSSSISVSQCQELRTNGKVLFGSTLCQAFNALTTGSGSTGSNAQAQAEYVGYQIDYAFQNNLTLNQPISMSDLHSAFSSVPYISWVDAPTYNKEIVSFSKFNVSAIWFFYDLWQFNFIVAFGGAVTLFGLVISIILGLMSRLIKGAALFLIYPTMLSIAPLDQFKAFKNWGQQFMSQVLMAIGSITAVNIIMLILPYLNSFSFFGIGLIDAIVNMVLLIVGMVMIKEFIGIVSGFIGAANAAETGNNLKGEVAGAIKSGAQITGKIGMGIGRFAVGGARLVGSAINAPIQAGLKARRHRKAHDQFVKEANAAEAEATAAGKQVSAAEGGLNAAQSGLAAAQAAQARGNSLVDMKAAMMKGLNEGTSFEDLGIEDTQANRDAYKHMRDATKGKTGLQAKLAAETAFNSTDQGKELMALSGQARAEGKSVKEMLAGNVNSAQTTVNAQQANLDKVKAKTKIEEKQERLKQIEADAKEHNHELKRDPKGGRFMYADREKYVAKEEKRIAKATGEWAATKKANKEAAKAERKAAKEEAKIERIKSEKVSGFNNLVNKAFNPKNAGLQMADSFVKSLKAIPDALGFDKFLKGFADIIKGGLTLKGGPFEKFGSARNAEGDNLQRQMGEQRKQESRETQALLKQISDKLDANNKAIQEGNKSAQNYYAKKPE